MLKELIIGDSRVPLKRLSIFYGYSNVSNILLKEDVTAYVFPMERSLIFENFKSINNKKEILSMCSVILGLTELIYDEESEKFTVDKINGQSINGLSGGTSQLIGVLTIVMNYQTFGKNGVYIVHPEASLHPKSQSALGTFLVNTYVSNIAFGDPQIFIDTWSDHIMNGMRVALMRDARDSGTKKGITDIVVNYVKNDTYMTLFLKENGSFTHWPEGFMDQNQKDMMELLKARK